MSGSAFQRQVDVYLSRGLSPKEQSATLAAVAKRGLAELIASGRAPAHYRRFVDGVEGAAEDAVKPGGVIAYRFEPLSEVITFALAFLRNRAPRRSGALRSGFFVSLDGRFVHAEDFNPARMGNVQEAMIGNWQPYNRLADVQTAGSVRLKFSSPAEMYGDTVRAVKRRFGAAVDAARLHRLEFPGQYLLRTGQRAGKRVDSPGIVLRRR